MEFLQVTFRVRARTNELPDLVDSILLEQTVETPIEVAERVPFVLEHMTGHVREIVGLGDGSSRVVLDLPTTTARADVGQFLNVLFGNVSLHERVSLDDFIVPPSVLSGFPGPRFGLKGIRDRLRVFDRPLTCSALKPVGLEPQRLASLCRTFAHGGIDLIKDDHYLADHIFCPFNERVSACQRAVDEASAETGRTVMYCPNLSGTPDQVLRQYWFAREQGVGAVMLAPMLLGLPTFFEFVDRHLDVPVLLHPSFAGSTRISPPALLGKLFRLFGGDAVIFANYGGRFSYSPEVCNDIAQRLREPWEHVAEAFPVPAGGMTVERARELVEFFGNDTILLVGGSLLAAGDDLLDRTRAFTSAVAENALV